MKSIYDNRFFDEIKDESYNSAKEVAPIIFSIINPKNIVDLGCGAGYWLKAFKEFSPCIKIKGIDGDYIDRGLLCIANDEFQPMDLTNPITIDEKYELAMSLEVAEHLPENKAKQFVNSLTQLSDIVLFGAAIPGQPGVNHINGQYPEYWASHFKDNGYVCVDILRPRIWTNKKIEPYYRQNMLFFINKASIDKYPIINSFYIDSCKIQPPLNIVHPHFMMKDLSTLGIRSSLKLIRRALKNKIK